jgi:hypothetical protein
VITLEIPEYGCDKDPDDPECPFNYDSIYCIAYKRSIGNHTNKGNNRPPKWCKASAAFVMEARGKKK